ncbi:Alkyldihydroxyacetonephosphate synthase, peroxisomal [Cyphomyrmex costatus]|uniref:Alkyldihydroxyacetonephosphate synthase, peroxisomal n=1 Tax=Cyphomyrmex costatus TaxID=456900 RepID=A0A151I8N1_9HYME|nr:Alkyldihydroxyacetonephosphate synthase, peroxisomal [Cyphomyrmex costatus]
MSEQGKHRTTAEMANEPIEFESVVPKIRQQLLKWNGWGYKDSGFRVNDKNVIEFTGNSVKTTLGISFHRQCERSLI